MKKRPRINNNLVATTSDSETKLNYAKRNKSRRVVYMMQIFGGLKQITKDEYERLKNAGYKVEIVNQWKFFYGFSLTILKIVLHLHHKTNTKGQGWLRCTVSTSGPEIAQTKPTTFPVEEHNQWRPQNSKGPKWWKQDCLWAAMCVGKITPGRRLFYGNSFTAVTDLTANWSYSAVG